MTEHYFNNVNGENFHAVSDFKWEDSNISVNATNKRNSIFIADPTECFYYPYNPIYKNGSLNVRMFDFRASKSITK